MTPPRAAPTVASQEALPRQAAIFIGHHKVGSSALQQFLGENAVALIRAGILYPMVEFEGMAMLLAAATGRSTLPETPPVNMREAHNALAFRLLAEAKGGQVPPFHKMLPHSRQMVHAINLQIRELKPEALVLASEVFSNFGLAAPELIDRVRQIKRQATTTLLVTFRRIDDYLVSWHAQRLRFNHKVRPLSAGGVDDYWKSIHFDYRRLLEPWTTRMPGAQLVARPYSEVVAAGGSVADFTAQSGLAFPSGLTPERTSNQGFHRALIEIVRRANNRLPPGESAALRQAVLDVQTRLTLPAAREIEMIGAANRAALADRFGPIHRWLGDVAGRQPFFPDFDKVSEVLPMPEAEANAIALPQLAAALAGRVPPGVQEFLDTLELGETA